MGILTYARMLLLSFVEAPEIFNVTFKQGLLRQPWRVEAYDLQIPAAERESQTLASYSVVAKMNKLAARARGLGGCSHRRRFGDVACRKGSLICNSNTINGDSP